MVYWERRIPLYSLLVATLGGLQLLPETKKRIDVKIPGENRRLYMGLVLLFIVCGVFFLLSSRASRLEEELTLIDVQIASLEGERDKKAETELIALRKQIVSMSKLFKGHTYATKAIDRLEGKLEPGIVVKSFKWTAERKTISLAMQARDYTSVSKQVATFLADDQISDVILGALRHDNDGAILFGADLLLKDNAYFY